MEKQVLPGFCRQQHGQLPALPPSAGVCTDSSSLWRHRYGSASSWPSDYRLANMPVIVPHSKVDLKLIIISE